MSADLEENPWTTGLRRDEVVEAILQGGYPLEVKMLHAFRDAEMRPQLGAWMPTAADNTEPREIDLIAQINANKFVLEERLYPAAEGPRPRGSPELPVARSFPTWKFGVRYVMDFEAQLNQLPGEELTPGAKLLQALELYEEGLAMQRLNFQRRYPAASTLEIDRLGAVLQLLSLIEARGYARGQGVTAKRLQLRSALKL